MGQGPRIAIVTAAYQAGRYLRETIDSVASQLQPDDEYVVVDDGSTDDTPAILSRLPSRIRVIRQDNAGEAAAVNRGIAAVTTDVVAIINADDPILPGLVTAARLAFRDDAELAAIYPDWQRIDQDGRIVRQITCLEYDYKVMVAQHMCIPGPGAFFRTSVMPNEPVRDARAAGVTDFDFWLRFGLKGAKIQRLPQTLATWRSHAGGTTFTYQTAALAEAKMAMIDRLFARSDMPPVVAGLEPLAKSAAAYHAALVGLRGRNVPALRYALRSYRLLPRWPRDVLSHQQRSLPHLAYASLQPLSGLLHDAIGSLLPARFSRAAILDQTFGQSD